jgi:hypothetical protein
MTSSRYRGDGHRQQLPMARGRVPTLDPGLLLRSNEASAVVAFAVQRMGCTDHAAIAVR